MAKFLVLAENNTLLQRWEKILRLFNLKTMMLKDFSSEQVNFDEVEVVFVITEKLTTEVTEQLKVFKENLIPIICTKREVPEDLTNEEIMEIGICATINEHPSVHTLLFVTNLVTNGGIYIDRETEGENFV